MLTRADLAKYPFLAEASDYVRELGFSIDEIAAPEFGPVLDRAEKRLEEALSKGQVSNDSISESTEILSFPVRSEEHTSELQSHHDLVCRLLLEKKKKYIR